MDKAKKEFLDFVEVIIQENPEWFAEAVLSMQDGIQGRLKKETDKRSEAEFALAMSYHMINKKELESKPANRSSIHKVLKSSHAFVGTKFAEDLDV